MPPPAVLAAKVGAHTIWLLDGRYTCTCTTFLFRGRCSYTTRLEAFGPERAGE